MKDNLINDDSSSLDNYLRIDDTQLDEYLRSNSLYIKIFFAFHDYRILSTKAKWQKKGKEIEFYIKEYVENLAEKYNLPEMKLTPTEVAAAWKIRQHTIKTEKDIKIQALTIRSWVKNKNNKKWVIIVHGLNSHKFRATFFGLIYLRQGYNILVYDQRNHGESSRTVTSMGEREKYDLAVIVKYLFDNYKVKKIGFHGWSMGTFVIVEYLKTFSYKRNKVLWAVLDSTINSLQELYFIYMKRLKINYYQHYYAIQQYAIRNKGYDPNSLLPGYGLKILNKIPFLYILNKKDHLTPYPLGKKAYENKVRNEKKKISKKVVFDCDHVRGIINDAEKYINSIDNFIKENN